MSETILNIAAYRFVEIDNLDERRAALRDICAKLALKGTILLSEEGINLFLAGIESNIRQFMQYLYESPLFMPLEIIKTKFKESWSDAQPFNRMLVKLKKEIIPLGKPNIKPHEHTAPALPPEALKQWLDDGKDFILLDTRNNYEVRLRTFKQAKTLDLDHFRNFPEACQQQLPTDSKEKPVVMFCTGGIRCEKASVALEQQGFQQVYQLEGGILNYFEHCGGAHYQGDCFVFDQRVAVNPELVETDVEQCFMCLNPLTVEEQQNPSYVPGVSCPYCVE